MTKSTHGAAVAGVVVALMAVLAPAVSYGDTQINFATTPGSSAQAFARASQASRVAQAFVPAEDSSAVSFLFYYAKEAAGATDSVQIAVQADSGGHPSGVDLGVLSVAPFTSLPNDNATECSGTQQGFLSATGTVSLAAGTTYWAVVRSTGMDLSDSIFPYVCGGTYTPHTQAQLGGGSWSDLYTKGLAGTAFLTAGAPPDTAEATSTPDQGQQNLANAVYMYFLAFFLVVWLMRKH